MRDAPLTHDKPQVRRDRAPSHWCRRLGCRVYCPQDECPQCLDEEQTRLPDSDGSTDEEVRDAVEDVEQDVDDGGSS